MTVNVAEMAHKYLYELISHLLVDVIKVSNAEVILKTKTYALSVIAGREGVDMVYYDTEAKPITGYNVSIYLINKRRHLLVLPKSFKEPTDFNEFISQQMCSLAQDLRSAALDILGGSKEWLKDYTWPVIQPRNDIAKLLADD